MDQNNRLEQKAVFIKVLAEFISGDTTYKWTMLGSSDSLAIEWANIRNTSGVFGNVSVEKTVDHLTELLS